MAIPTLSGDDKKIPAKKTTTTAVVVAKPKVGMPMLPKPPVDSLKFSHDTFDNMTKRLKGKKADTFHPYALTSDERAAVKYIAPRAAAYQAQIDAHAKKLNKKDLDEDEINTATGGKGADAISHIKAYVKYRKNTNLDEKPLSEKTTYDFKKVPVRGGASSGKPEGTANVYSNEKTTTTTINNDEGATTLRAGYKPSVVVLPKKKK